MISSKTSGMSPTSLTSTQFRAALAQFATGVTVVTAERPSGQVHGMTANSFTSVSLHPPLILICVASIAQLLPLVKEKHCFGVSILKAGQEAMSRYFAQPDEKPETEAALGIRYRRTPTGIPLLENALANFACKVVNSQIAGDHTIFLAEIESVDLFDGDPLIFFHHNYRQLAP
ncbi:MAG TPA: flavin reductase family protein [Candidatus Acidoferrum sp.]|jgi:flavin reductase (DIM6/NTAB) family NADH-FMN oxidoreductase RutF